MYAHFALFNAARFVIGHPSGLRQSILESNAVLSSQILLQLQQLSVPEEYFLLDRLDADLHDINSVLEHVVTALVCS